MENVYDVNGLVFWDENEVCLREFLVGRFERAIRSELLGMNPAWQFTRIEAPLLTPRDLVNPNYTADDIWLQVMHEGERGLVLRPETTPGSYLYAQQLLRASKAKPPFVVWQAGKSFRREQDQVSKNLRLKEFYQQEFQCIFTEDTLNDYHAKILEPMRRTLQEAIGIDARVVLSDRLPSYSLKTCDVEVDDKIAGRWMEVCSISLRKDFPCKFVLNKKDGSKVEKALLVLEVAIGLDRCVYEYCHRGGTA